MLTWVKVSVRYIASGHNKIVPMEKMLTGSKAVQMSATVTRRCIPTSLRRLHGALR